MVTGTQSTTPTPIPIPRVTEAERNERPKWVPDLLWEDAKEEAQALGYTGRDRYRQAADILADRYGYRQQGDGMDAVVFLVKDRYDRMVYAGREYGVVERAMCHHTEGHTGGPLRIYAHIPDGNVLLATVDHGASQRTVEGLPFTDDTR